MNEIYLTREGFNKLNEELKYLKNVKRRELSKEIGEARAHGDLSENAEYDAAKEAQGFNEKRINELEEKLNRVRILDDMDIPTDRVAIGTKVEVYDISSKQNKEYMLVSELEADPDNNRISITSPIGRGLVCKKLDETVDIRIPNGIIRYKVLKISR